MTVCPFTDVFRLLFGALLFPLICPSSLISCIFTVFTFIAQSFFAAVEQQNRHLGAGYSQSGFRTGVLYLQ